MHVTPVYRDEWLLAVHKPAGLLVHRSPIDRHETVFALQQARALNDEAPVFPVHRLDRPTSGLLLFARDAETARLLGLALMAGAVEKTYQAVVRGWTPASGEIDQPLRDKSADRRVQDELPLRAARTRFRRLACTELPVAIETYPTSRYSWLELQPVTGRQHQLRRHLQFLGHPLVGDTNYGRTRQNHYFATRFPPGRLMLAATTLSFQHPVTGQALTLTAPLEDSFQRVLSIFDVSC